MLQLENDTPFIATLTILPDPRGIETLYVLVKATVTLHPRLSLADVQLPLSLGDEYHGDPSDSSLRAASDVHLGKPGTDVLLVGSARPAHGRPAARVQVSMTVADRRKDLLVTGDRVWRDGRPSSPPPFEAMPLVWERAFGGQHRQGAQTLAEERNPVGCGFAGSRSAGDMEGLPVPNVEDLESPLERVGQQVTPACLAPIAPAWLPRRRFAGTYDGAWQRGRAPYLPADFDRRFFQCAIPEFAFDRYLEPGERVQVSGVHGDGPVDFAIPDGRLEITAHVGGVPQRMPASLETVLVEPDDNRASFTWRASLPCDRQALKIQRVVIGRERGRTPA